MTKAGTRRPLVTLSTAALAMALVGCTNGDEEPAESQGTGAEGQQDDGAAPAEDDADAPEKADDAGNGAVFDVAACDLLSAEDLSPVLGVDLEAGELPSDDELRFDDECIFEVTAAPGNSFQLTLTEATSPSNVDAEWQGYRNTVNVVEDLDDIGEGAFIAQTAAGMELVILTDGVWIGAFATSGVEMWEDSITEIAKLLDANL